MSRTLLSLVVALLLAVSPGSGSALTGAGTIAGVVRDSSGGAIPGATVHIVNEDTGVGVDAITIQGAYRAAELAPGRYRVGGRSVVRAATRGSSSRSPDRQ
jgi:hypothetical protein